MDLMAQRQDFQLQGSPIAERHADGPEQRDNDGSHRRTLSADGGKVNVFKTNEILGRHTGWGNAMRYMLTGDHWSAEESYRMRVTQQIAATPAAALEAGMAMARTIGACGPLSIKATLTSAHQYVDPVEADALSRLGAQYAALYRTEDFVEGRRAEAEGRAPKYQGK